MSYREAELRTLFLSCSRDCPRHLSTRSLERAGAHCPRRVVYIRCTILLQIRISGQQSQKKPFEIIVMLDSLRVETIFDRCETVACKMEVVARDANKTIQSQDVIECDTMCRVLTIGTGFMPKLKGWPIMSIYVDMRWEGYILLTP